MDLQKEAIDKNFYYYFVEAIIADAESNGGVIVNLDYIVDYGEVCECKITYSEASLIMFYIEKYRCALSESIDIYHEIEKPLEMMSDIRKELLSS